MDALEHLPRVLVVDDDAEMAYLAQYLLEQCGYHSDNAMNVPAFLLAYSVKPSVVMLDLNMPNGASEEIAEFMALQQAKHPIIFVTGRPPEEIERRRQLAQAQGLRIAAVLYKPFWIEDIVKAMASAMTIAGAEV
jgi:CheY-like chemotaxis protein